VAIYRTIDDRDADRVHAKAALVGSGPGFTFSMTGVAPGTYYVDICAMPVTSGCFNPTPATVTITAGQTATGAYQLGF
jgi:hypothetical protein